jgi:hypothetical protein
MALLEALGQTLDLGVLGLEGTSPAVLRMAQACHIQVERDLEVPQEVRLEVRLGIHLVAQSEVGMGHHTVEERRRGKRRGSRLAVPAGSVAVVVAAGEHYREAVAGPVVPLLCQ